MKWKAFVSSSCFSKRYSEKKNDKESFIESIFQSINDSSYTSVADPGENLTGALHSNSGRGGRG